MTNLKRIVIVSNNVATQTQTPGKGTSMQKHPSHSQLLACFKIVGLRHGP